MRTSSITPIPIEAIDFATQGVARPFPILVVGFVLLTVSVIIAGLLGAL
jgi:hypothetical protein